jgi:hypothetical protein
VTRALEAAGERVHPASAWRASRTSSPRRTATTCTRSRRCGGWTRSRPATSRAARRAGRRGPGLQRRDGRAHSPLPPAARPLDLHRGRADLVPDPLGRGLPTIRDWTEQHFAFPGYVSGTRLNDEQERQELRERFGYRDDQVTCIATAGGTAVATALLNRVLEALPVRREAAARAPARRRRSPHRPLHAAGARRRRDRPGLPARARPAPRGVRHRGRAGRADDVHGADREPPAVPVLPAGQPLRAAAVATGSTATAPAGGCSSPRSDPRTSRTPSSPSSPDRSTTSPSPPTGPLAPQPCWPSSSDTASWPSRAGAGRPALARSPGRRPARSPTPGTSRAAGCTSHGHRGRARPGDAFVCEAGHDAWVVGDEQVELLEVAPATATG